MIFFVFDIIIFPAWVFPILIGHVYFAPESYLTLRVEKNQIILPLFCLFEECFLRLIFLSPLLELKALFWKFLLHSFHQVSFCKSSVSLLPLSLSWSIEASFIEWFFWAINFRTSIFLFRLSPYSTPLRYYLIFSLIAKLLLQLFLIFWVITLHFWLTQQFRRVLQFVFYIFYFLL